MHVAAALWASFLASLERGCHSWSKTTCTDETSEIMSAKAGNNSNLITVCGSRNLFHCFFWSLHTMDVMLNSFILKRTSLKMIISPYSLLPTSRLRQMTMQKPLGCRIRDFLICYSLLTFFIIYSRFLRSKIL